MNKKIGVLLLLACMLSISAITHAFYVSLTIIEYDTKHKSLEFSTKFFIDDLQKVFKEEYEINFDVSDEKHKEEMDKLLANYLSTHLSITIDGVSKEINYVGAEIDVRKVWFYYEVKGVENLNENIKLQNTFFYDVIKEQKNIFNFKLNRYKKALVFEQDNDTQSLILEKKL